MLRYIGNPSADSSNLGKVRLFIGGGGDGGGPGYFRIFLRKNSWLENEQGCTRNRKTEACLW